MNDIRVDVWWMQDGGVASAAYGRTHLTHARSGTTPVFPAPLLALCTVCSNSWGGMRLIFMPCTPVSLLLMPLPPLHQPNDHMITVLSTTCLVLLKPFCCYQSLGIIITSAYVKARRRALREASKYLPAVCKRHSSWVLPCLCIHSLVSTFM